MYCSIDIETTGLNPETDQILEVGAVLALKPGSLLDMPTFHTRIRYDRLEGAPYALMLNSKIIEDMAKLPREDVDGWIRLHDLGKLFRKWLEENGVERVHPCGKNFQGFDRQFLWRVPGWPKQMFTHRALDCGTMYASWHGIPGLDAFLDPPGLEGKAHEALFDAYKALYWAMKALDKNTPAVL